MRSPGRTGIPRSSGPQGKLGKLDENLSTSCIALAAVHFVKARKFTGLAPMVFEHDSFRRGGQGELYLVQRRRRKKPEDAQRDADREAEVASLRSRITELERRLSQLEMENAQLRSRDYSLQLA